MRKFDKLETSQLEGGTPEDKRIIIKSVFSKEAKLKVQPTKSVRTGRYLGIETNLSDIQKMERGYLPDENSFVILKHGYELNLNDPQDAADWEWIQHSPHVAKDFEEAQRNKEAWYYVHRPGAESRKRVAEIEMKAKLINKILNDTETNLYNRARLLGIDMSDQPISDVKGYLLSAVEDKRRRHEVEEVYNSENISVKLMLYHGLDEGILQFDGFVYRYNNIMLGTTEALALDYLTNPINLSVVREIEAAIYPSTETTDIQLSVKDSEMYEPNFDDTKELETEKEEVKETKAPAKKRPARGKK